MSYKDYEDYSSYEELRSSCISAFSRTYKDSVAFDLCKVDKEDSAKLLTDRQYTDETKSIRAKFFASNISVMDKIIEAQDDEKGTSPSELLRVITMGNDMIFKDVGFDQDESNALNIVVLKMTKEEIEDLETVDVFIDGPNEANASIEKYGVVDKDYVNINSDSLDVDTDEKEIDTSNEVITSDTEIEDMDVW